MIPPPRREGCHRLHRVQPTLVHTEVSSRSLNELHHSGKRSRRVLNLIYLRTLQVFHLEALLHEKTELSKITLIESFIFYWTDDLKRILI
jgi:hypothetical protein